MCNFFFIFTICEIWNQFSMAIDKSSIYGMAWSGALQVEKAKGENGCIPTVYSAGTPKKKTIYQIF